MLCIWVWVWSDSCLWNSTVISKVENELRFFWLNNNFQTCEKLPQYHPGGCMHCVLCLRTTCVHDPS